MKGFLWGDVMMRQIGYVISPVFVRCAPIDVILMKGFLLVAALKKKNRRANDLHRLWLCCVH